MINFIEEARKKLKDVWERKKDTTTEKPSKKDEEDIQRAKNFKRSKENDENTLRADKEVKEKGFL